MDNRTDFLDLLRHYLESSRDETERVQQELRENDELVRQGTSEVERLTQRNGRLRSKLAAMESDLEAHSRSEIRSLYQAASEAQLRLFIMRNRVEQLQSKQQILDAPPPIAAGFASPVARFLPLQGGAGPPRAAAAATAGGKVERGGFFAGARYRRAEEAARPGPNSTRWAAQSLTNLILQGGAVQRLFAQPGQRGQAGQPEGFRRHLAEDPQYYLFQSYAP